MPVAPWRSWRDWAALIAVTSSSLIIDLVTKWWAFRSVAGAPVHIDRQEVMEVPHLSLLIPQHDPIRVIPSLLDFTLVLNPGAVFGIGAGKRWFFVGFTLIAILFCLYLFARWTRRAEWSAHIAIGMVLGGGLGNLYDRLTFACVRDFIHPLPGVMLPFGWELPWSGREVWPYVSNVADLFLLIGIAILGWKALRGPRLDEPTRATAK